MTERRLAYLPFLDGLRAVSILLVMSYHGLDGRATALLGPHGWVGVYIFFVISGFLITRLLLEEERGAGRIEIGRFYQRRALRILPAYLVFLLVSLALNPFEFARMPAAVLVSALFMTEYDLALRLNHVLGSGLELTWSLAVEEKFYLLGPPLLRLAGPGRRTTLVLKLMAAALVWKTALVLAGIPWMGGFDCLFDAILWGVLAALVRADDGLWRRIAPRLREPAATLLPLALLLLLARFIGPPVDPTGRVARGILWVAALPSLCALSAWLILALDAAPGSHVGRALSWWPARLIGRLSYSLYLWHLTAFALVNGGFGGGWTPPAGWEGPVRAGAALGLATLSYLAVERPFLGLRHRMRPTANASTAATA